MYAKYAAEKWLVHNASKGSPCQCSDIRVQLQTQNDLDLIFLLCGEVFLSVMVFHNPPSALPWSDCSSPSSHHWLWISIQHRFKSRPHHTCHSCPKLAPWHFYKVWENKWWTCTLLIMVNLLSQIALELTQSLHLRAGMHPSTSFVRLFDSRTRCAKMLSERRAFYPTVVMVLWDVQ